MNETYRLEGRLKSGEWRQILEGRPGLVEKEFNDHKEFATVNNTNWTAFRILKLTTTQEVVREETL